MANVKRNTLTYDEVFSLIDYDPVEGTFTWKISPAKHMKPGSPAGCFKSTRSSTSKGTQKYLYINLKKYGIPASRIAWMLIHKEWPDNSVLFKDGNPANLKAENLQEGVFTRNPSSDPIKEQKRTGRTRAAMRDYALKRYYGLSLKGYEEKLEAQNHTCAICHGPEVAIIHGKLKPLSVDHCHTTGKVRDLLCSHCNHMIGHANERIEVLQSAIKYLEKHSDCANDRQNEGTS